MGAYIFSVLIGYLAGSIPFGLLLSQAAGLGDIRKIGSGNIGATNVLRTGNKSVAALTLLADVLKGFLPPYLAGLFWGDTALVLAGFAALAGHILPVWLNFKGGKGVATAAGILFAWAWPVALAALATWLVVFGFRRISSLAALGAAIAAVPAAWLWAPARLWPVLALALVVVITHRANIARLLAGTEPRSSFSKKP